MLTLRMFLISGGSTCDIDAVKTSNTDSDDEDSKIGGKKQKNYSYGVGRCRSGNSRLAP